MGVQQYFRRKKSQQANNAFISTWNTANTSSGSSASNQVRLPLISTGTYDFVVDWGDSTSDVITSWNQAEVTHTYAGSGNFTITITGTLTGWVFGGTGDRLKILDIQNWGTIIFKPQSSTFGGSFRLCSNLNISANDTPSFEAGNQIGFFESCTNLLFNNSINSWDTSEITNLSRFFFGATNFNQNIGNWNVSNSSSLERMFQSASNFNNGGSDSIQNWHVSNCTSLFATFLAATAFNQPLNNWNVSNVVNLQSTFQQATAFNQPLNNWNVSNVTNFGITNNGMFRLANSFDQDISDWDVSKAASFNSFMQQKTNLNFSASNLDLIYQKWSLLTFVNTGLVIDFGSIKYTSAGSAGRAVLTGAPNNWTITDGGQV